MRASMPHWNCRKAFAGKITSFWPFLLSLPLLLSFSLSSASAFVPPPSIATSTATASIPNSSHRMQPCRFVIRRCLHGTTATTTAISFSNTYRNTNGRFVGNSFLLLDDNNSSSSSNSNSNNYRNHRSMTNTRKRKSSRVPTRRSARSTKQQQIEREETTEELSPSLASASASSSASASASKPYKLLMILSPAKTLNLEDDVPEAVAGMEFTKTLDELKSHRKEVVAAMKEHATSASKLGALLKTSQKITASAQTYWQDMSEDASAAGSGTHKPSIFMFNGAAYSGLDIATMATTNNLDYLQGHLRIVDPLYGWLRPMDRIEAYRLEMASKGVFANHNKDDPKVKMEEFWKPPIRACIEGEEQPAAGAAAGSSPTPIVIVNLASDEYSAAVDVPTKRMIKVVFKHGGRTIAVHAKRARGLMVRYMATRSVESLDQLLDFDLEGYSFRPEESTYQRGGDGEFSVETLASLQPEETKSPASKKKKTKKEQPLTLVFDRPGTWKRT